VKAAVVSHALKAVNIPEVIVHSGQHYDEKMSRIFWDELGIPEPLHNLNIGSGSHTFQTAQIMLGLENIFKEYGGNIKALMVYGDTNTTLAGALVAAKMDIPIVHVESGLRSFNREMPEEINRVVTDHLSSILFCPSDHSVQRLMEEGIRENVFNVGDVMYDCFEKFSKIAGVKADLGRYLDNGETASLITLHRPVNTDSYTTVQLILDELKKLPGNFLWPVHPRNRNNLAKLDIPSNVKLTEPLSYFEMLQMLMRCEKVITDSGGLQKEAYWAKKQCLTLREETEWVETLEGGWNTLTSVGELLYNFNKIPTSKWKPLYGDGKAAEKIAGMLRSMYFSNQ
jgi:UDP-GlcNAc3NAcA epimerase